MRDLPQVRVKRVYYGWILAATILVVWAISIGPRQSFSVFLLPLVEEFGASRSAVAATFSVHMAFYALGGWVLGIVLDRVGPKRIILCSTAAWALVLAAASQLTSIWQLYLVYGVLGGACTGGFAYVANNALIARWFIRYRGLASGIAQAGVPLGPALYGPLSQLGVARLGWRTTHLAFGVAIALTAIPLVLAIHRNDPRELGLAPDGLAAGGDRAACPVGLPPGHAGPGVPRGYWPIFLANFLRGLIMYAILVHQVAYLTDVGFSKMAAASSFSTVSLLGIPGGLAAGAISDRIGRLRAYAGLAVLYAIGYLVLLLVRRPDQGLLLSVSVLALGLAVGGVSPVFASFLTDRLQGPRLGFLLGLQNIAFGVGAALGPYVAAVLFDLRHSYTLAFLLMAAASLGSAVILAATVRRLARTA